MKKVDAYECDHCAKLIDNKLSCKSHEYRCYFNPRTRSCASCSSLYLVLEKAPGKPKSVMDVQKCKNEIDVSKRKLRTNCNHYVQREKPEVEMDF